jgi:hypothetical protein
MGDPICIVDKEHDPVAFTHKLYPGGITVSQLHLIPIAMLEIQIQSVLAAVFCAAGCLKLLLNIKLVTPTKMVTGGIFLCLAGKTDRNIYSRSVADLEGGSGSPFSTEICHQMLVKLKI